MTKEHDEIAHLGHGEPDARDKVEALDRVMRMREEQMFVHAYYAADRHLYDPAAQFGISGELAKVWARLIRKVYEADPLECLKCRGPMRVIALIDDPAVVREISCTSAAGNLRRARTARAA